ncbi:MAG: hypothetical protein ABS86_06750 [Sphingobium sp. SCN 64-10]|nr:MAG: hypothetical protein ABS86_06750 [Sphingobium sp. SCN 64-10]
MKLSKILPAAVVMGMAALASQPANAAYTFTGTADYFSVNSSANGDFKSTYSGPYGVYSNSVANTLNANGMPVYNPGYGGPALVNVNASNQLMWWTPGTNDPAGTGNTMTVTQTGNDVPFTLPFADNSFFAPNGGGVNDNNAFLTAIFTGTLTLDAASTVTFSLGADDDAFLFVDGVSLLQLGGIHEPTPVSVTSSVLGAGAHTVKLFYADRNKSQAVLNFNITAVTNAVPEPSTWAMMIGGLALVGLSMRRRKTTVSFA